MSAPTRPAPNPAGRQATRGWTVSPSAVAGAVTKHGAVLLVTLAAVVPIYFMVSTSLKTEVQYADSQLTLPTSPTLVNYQEILGNPMFLTWIRNSFLLTVLSVSIGITISALAAYALACMDFPGRHTVFMVFVALLGAPAVTVAIPLFRLMVETKLINTLQGAVVAYVGLMIPYTTYFLTGFFRRLPPALFEAAQLDGANHLTIFRRIALPLSRPGVITLAIVNTLWVWNELLIAIIFLQRNDKRTLMAGLTLFQGEFSSNIPAVMAGLTIAALPMFVLYVTGVRYFLSGFMAGSEK